MSEFCDLIGRIRSLYVPDDAAILSSSFELHEDVEVTEWHNLADAIVLECKRARPLSTLQTAIFLLRQQLDETPVAHLSRVIVLGHLAFAVVIRFTQTGHVEDIMEAASLCREYAQASTSPHYRQPGQDSDPTSGIIQIAFEAMHDFGESIQMSSLETAMYLYSEVISRRPYPHPKRANSLYGLATAQIMGYLASTDNDPTDTLPLMLEALSLRQRSHPERCLYLMFTAANLYFMCRDPPIVDLAFLPLVDALMEDSEAKDLTEHSYSMRQRYRESGQMSEIDGAISRLRRSLDLHPPPHPMRHVSLLSLASALHDRNLQAPCIEDSDACISLFREALLLRSAGLLDEPDDVITFESSLHRDLDSITDFASALAYRFNLTGQHIDLRNSISLGKALLEHCPTYPELFSVHVAVGTAFSQQYRITGQTNDLSEAKKHYQEALRLIPSDHKMRSTVSANVANILVLEYLDLGQSSDKLDEALPLLRQHLADPYTPPGGRHISLDSLAGALLMKYESTGKQEYVDEAIGFYNEAFKILPVSHPNRPILLGNLAVGFSLRYEQTRQSYHLEQAIAFNRQALESMPTSHPQRFSHLLNLAICLTNRSKRISSLEDIQDSIALLESALQLCPASHLFALLNLGVALCHHFRQTHEIRSLDRAITCYREVQRDMHSHRPVRHRLCTGLASALIDRFEATLQCPDLEEAIIVLREGLNLIPPHHPGRCMSGILAGAFVRLYSATKNQKHLEDAVSAYRDVAKNYSCFLSSRLLHASDWAEIATANNHPSALEAYQEAINLAPMLVALGMNMKTRQEPLRMLGDLPRNAARVAICEGKQEVAIELLEEGRGVFWSQALRLRTPFDELRLKAPALAETLTMVSEKLEKGSFRDSPEFAHGKVERAMSLEQEEALYRPLDVQWHQALDEARKIDGLENLLRPKPFSALQSAAANGPVVVLNASDHECDGLILTLDGVKHVSFPNISTELLWGLIRLLRLAISQPGGRIDIPESIQTDLLTHRHGGMCVAPGQTSDDHFRSVLQRLWEDVAHPVIQALRLQKSDKPLRLWWCPTGLFALLPIHAAGVYDAKAGSVSVSDYVISSYTPTLGALQMKPPAPPSTDFMVAAIIQPEIPGRPELALPSTNAELEKIESRVPKAHLTKIGTPENPTSISKVISILPSVSIAHFACHGTHDQTSPLESALILSDGQLKVSKIMEKPLRNASLAFLSACETAMGDDKTPDENIHLAGSMLFAGFRGVVATMWTIQDADGPKVADAFYQHIFEMGEDGLPNTLEAAQALHLAVQKLRSEQGCSFRRWVPFVHYGL